jgi:hypothetical protein
MIFFVFDFILHFVFVLHQYVEAIIWPSQPLVDMKYMPEIKATPASVPGVKFDFYIHMDWVLRIDLKPVRKSSARFGRILARKGGALNIRCTLRMRFCASCISSFKTLFSVLGYIMSSFGRICVSVGVVRHPVSDPMGTRVSFSGNKAAGA